MTMTILLHLPVSIQQQIKLSHSGRLFDESEYLIPDSRKNKIHSEHLDEHHEMMFYYKIACIYFGTENMESIYYLENK
jgi:hypothetical protein